MLRFGAQFITLTADIEKAFHQINVDNDDRDYLRFLWLYNISSDQTTITKNRFVMVIFGITSPPLFKIQLFGNMSINTQTTQNLKIKL